MCECVGWNIIGKYIRIDFTNLILVKLDICGYRWIKLILSPNFGLIFFFW